MKLNRLSAILSVILYVMCYCQDSFDKKMIYFHYIAVAIPALIAANHGTWRAKNIGWTLG